MVVFGREFTKSADVLIYLYLDHFPFMLLLCKISQPSGQTWTQYNAVF